MNTALLTRTVHTRGFALSVALCTAVALAVYFFDGHTMPVAGDSGPALPSANEWFHSPVLSFAASLCAGGITLLFMTLLNKIYNVLRSMTSLYMAFFVLMQAAVPDLATQFFTGSMLAVVVPGAMMLLFRCYRNTEAPRTIFLIFALLSALAATQYCYLLYMVAFLAGCWQMEIFTRRVVSAAFTGILTPWILLAGFGVIDLTQLNTPELVSIFDENDFNNTLLLILSLALTVLIAMLAYVLNVLKTIAYNARARAYNGVFVIMAVATVAGMCIDYHNVVVYVPMLNFCAAMEAAHYFSTHRGDRSFVAIFTVIAAYAAFFICQTVI